MYPVNPSTRSLQFHGCLRHHEKGLSLFKGLIASQNLLVKVFLLKRSHSSRYLGDCVKASLNKASYIYFHMIWWVIHLEGKDSVYNDLDLVKKSLSLASSHMKPAFF